MVDHQPGTDLASVGPGPVVHVEAHVGVSLRLGVLGEGPWRERRLSWACNGHRPWRTGVAGGGNSTWRPRGLPRGPRAVPCGCMLTLHLLERDQQFAFSVWLQRDVILSTHLTSEADTAVLKSLPCVTCGKPGARSLHSCWRASYFRC